MVEIEYQNERYIVENGKWYRRLKVGEVVNFVNQMRSSLDGKWLQCSALISGIVSSCEVNNYRVPCTDPRPPFVVGQRVKVARRPGDAYLDQLFGQCGVVSGIDATGEVGCEFDYIDVHVSLPPWCLDPVEPAFGEKIIDRMEKFTEELEASDNDPKLDHILRKLKPHTRLAADVRRIKRECYQKLAALLPEEMR